MTARRSGSRSRLWITIVAAISVALVVAVVTVFPRSSSEPAVTVAAGDRAVPGDASPLQVIVEGGAETPVTIDAFTSDGERLTSSLSVTGGERRVAELPLTPLGRAVFGTCAVGREVELRVATGGSSRVVPVDLERDSIRCAPLAWAPPELERPETVSVSDDTSILRLDPGRDYRLNLPDSKRVGGLQIYGGRNVVLIGGHITVPDGDGPDQAQKALAFGDQTGTVHVEGVLIDSSAGGPADGISIRAPQAVLQLQNSRIVGLRGTTDGVHADVVQPWGGVKELRIDRLSGSSHFQGLQIPEDRGAIGRADLRSVNLTALPEIDGGGHMLWLTHQGCSSYPVRLERVFVTPRDDRDLATTVWPEALDQAECPAAYEEDQVSWPDLPVEGAVQEGAPPRGPFVPPFVAGLDYLTPGYADPGT